MLLVPNTASSQGSSRWDKLAHAIGSGISYYKGATLTDEEVASVCKEYVKELDAQMKVASSTSSYSKRLKKLTRGISKVGQYPADFKVYITKDINAFACGNGSVRVYSALMDVMDDAELIAIIGHEIGHVVNQDTKNAMKKAYKRQAAMLAVGAVSERAGKWAEGSLGQLAMLYASTEYSREQEYAADEYGRKFAIKKGYSRSAMVDALKKLQKVSEKNPGAIDKYVMSMFSDHPLTQDRIDRLENAE